MSCLPPMTGNGKHTTYLWWFGLGDGLWHCFTLLQSEQWFIYIVFTKSITINGDYIIVVYITYLWCFTNIIPWCLPWCTVAPPKGRCQTRPKTSTYTGVTIWRLSNTKWRYIVNRYIHMYIMHSYIYIYIYICIILFIIIYYYYSLLFVVIIIKFVAMLFQDMAWPALMTQGQDQRHAGPTSHFA